MLKKRMLPRDAGKTLIAYVYTYRSLIFLTDGFLMRSAT